MQQALRDTYRSVEDLDLYVGLFAEEPGPGALFGRLLERIISVDAFSEALNNPLLAPRLFTPGTFTSTGMRIIGGTRRFSQLVHRNLPEENGSQRVVGFGLGRGGDQPAGPG